MSEGLLDAGRVQIDAEYPAAVRVEQLQCKLAHQSQPDQRGNFAESRSGHPQSLHCDRAQRCEGCLFEFDAVGHARYEILGDADDFGVVRVTRTRAGYAIANGEIRDAFSYARHDTRARITKRLRSIQPRGHGPNRGQRALLGELSAHLFDEVRSGAGFADNRFAREVHRLLLGAG